ncbi:MAG: prenyltransferase/squalene oxidase repeat-containing protein, partial [Planctomycetota bacterium]
ALPQRWFKRLRLPVVSYALPALVAIGLVKFKKHPPKNPITRWLRRSVTERCLSLVERMQPDSGGFLEATPLTSFVVMALAASGHAEHPVVRSGVEFLLASVRQSGAWPIDTDLACWNTTLAINALCEGGRRKAEGGSSAAELDADSSLPPSAVPLPPSIDWLLACQHTERHPFTDADPGGWAWTNLSGGVPDADDTPGALLVLAKSWDTADAPGRDRLASAARQAIGWLLDLQNADGGWPTFCRGWGKLPFDRSATDLTAHALRALDAWQHIEGWRPAGEWRPSGEANAAVSPDRIESAILGGLRFLAKEQQDDGSWKPLWFGNQHRDDESNPVYGTARVVRALGELSRSRPDIDATRLERGVAWLLDQQHADGGWGSDPHCPPPRDAAGVAGAGVRGARIDADVAGIDETPVLADHTSVEETAVAVEALCHAPEGIPGVGGRIQAGADWLAAAIQHGEHRAASPIGLYFAKLWYYERLYPLSFATAALGAVISRRDQRSAGRELAPHETPGQTPVRTPVEQSRAYESHS